MMDALYSAVDKMLPHFNRIILLSRAKERIKGKGYVI